MEAFIARENIRNFKRQLEKCTDSAKGLTLRDLLALQEVRLAELEECDRCEQKAADLPRS